MTEKTIDLDQHRGMAAQKATDLRLLADVEAEEKALRLRQDELEAHFLAGRREAAEKRRDIYSIFSPAPWPGKTPADRSSSPPCPMISSGSGANRGKPPSRAPAREIRSLLLDVLEGRLAAAPG
jgi:hypothetical protein